MSNIWKDGMLGLIVGDALGVPVEFMSRTELMAVNLGEDTDTVGAVAGGLAGLYYKEEGIPQEWTQVLQRREWIEEVLQGV